MVAGKIFVFWFLLGSFAVLGYLMYSVKRGKVPQFRKIAGLDAISEGVGRATELGRPIYYTPGRGTLTDASLCGHGRRAGDPVLRRGADGEV